MLSEQVAQYHLTRANSQPLPRGSAPYTTSNFFKTASKRAKPAASKWNHRLSQEAGRQGGATLKAFVKTANPKDVVSLGTARPAPEFYPWNSMTFKATDMHGMVGHDNTSHADMSCAKGEEAFDLGDAMNYGYAAGSPQVIRFITEHIEIVHRPPYSDWETALTCGSTSGIDILFRILCDRGDWVLTEAYTYPGTIEAVRTLGLNTIGVKMDEDGLSSVDLDRVLNDWDCENGKKPKVLYTIPCGQNPTGVTQSIERRKAIYEVAERHDLMIIEDDPYFFIQLGGESIEMADNESRPNLEAYLRKLPPSYLALDTSGRVLRLDATSKILAPGLRCGWVTACTQLIGKFLNYTELCTVAPSGPSQVMLYKLLDETWGHEGFIRWLIHLSSQYSRRSSILLDACKRHLPSEICRWAVPTAGMFLWIDVDWRRHPTVSAPERCAQTPNEKAFAVEDKVYAAARDNGVLVSRGSWFAVEQRQSDVVSFRMTFAAAAEDTLEMAVARFGDAVCKEFSLE